MRDTCCCEWCQEKIHRWLNSRSKRHHIDIMCVDSMLINDSRIWNDSGEIIMEWEVIQQCAEVAKISVIMLIISYMPRWPLNLGRFDFNGPSDSSWNEISRRKMLHSSRFGCEKYSSDTKSFNENIWFWLGSKCRRHWLLYVSRIT